MLKRNFFKYLQKVKIDGINLGMCKLGFNPMDNVSNDDQFIMLWYLSFDLILIQVVLNSRDSTKAALYSTLQKQIIPAENDDVALDELELPSRQVAKKGGQT